MLLDSQKKLREFITESVKDANEQQFNKILIMINKIIIGMETSILQNDITYHYFDLPTKKSDLNNHLTTHPITELARTQVLTSFNEKSKN